MTLSPAPSPVAAGRPGPILYEVNNMALKAGTGIATYARHLAQAAARLGYESHGLIGVEGGLAGRDRRLNEILAFDATRDDLESLWEVALRYARYPFNALGGIRPAEIPLSGLVVGPMAETFKVFRRLFAATRLADAAIGHFSIYGQLAQLKLENRPRLFHATQPVPLAVKGAANVYTIHDLVPLRLPYATLVKKKYFYRMLMELARTADHIVTVSEHSKRDIIEFLGIDERRVTNTYQSVEIPADLLARSNHDVADDLAKLFGLEFGGYFLFYGAIEPKKNVSRLVDAYAASGSKLPLVIAGGGGWQNRADLRKIRDERFVNFQIDGDIVRRQRKVRRLEYLPRDHLVALIRGARAVLFPSIYEGFGLPVIEAMTLGTPVVTSNLSSLPEIAGDAALLVDPYSIEDITRAIRSIEADADLREALAERGRGQARKFSAKAYDERLRQLYEKL
ncbi:MAG: glycosyltransferase family 1 protein [Planctomycetota bacterium]